MAWMDFEAPKRANSKVACRGRGGVYDTERPGKSWHEAAPEHIELCRHEPDADSAHMSTENYRWPWMQQSRTRYCLSKKGVNCINKDLAS